MTHLEHTRGDSLRYTVAVSGPGGVPLDLGGASLFWTLKADPADDDDDAVAVADWTDGGASDGIAVADPATGRFVLTVAAEDTADWTPGQYVYDVQVITAGGQVRTVDSGNLTVYADVTQRTT